MRIAGLRRKQADGEEVHGERSHSSQQGNPADATQLIRNGFQPAQSRSRTVYFDAWLARKLTPSTLTSTPSAFGHHRLANYKPPDTINLGADRLVGWS